MISYPIELPPLLAIETSTAVCAVGAYVDGEKFEDTRYLERLHNQQALGMIDAVTTSVRERFGSKFAGFGLVAFGRGPGSFTGVRIGAALAQGIAFAHSAQILPLASLQVQADALFEAKVFEAKVLEAEILGGKNSDAGLDAPIQTCVVFVKSRQQMYYVQAFRAATAATLSETLVPSPWQSLATPELVCDLDDWSKWVAGLNLDAQVAPTLLGQQPDWLLQDPLAEAFVQDVAVTAGAVLRVGLAAFAQGGAVAPELGLPEYLSADSPWQPSA